MIHMIVATDTYRQYQRLKASGRKIKTPSVDACREKPSDSTQSVVSNKMYAHLEFIKGLPGVQCKAMVFSLNLSLLIACDIRLSSRVRMEVLIMRCLVVISTSKKCW